MADQKMEVKTEVKMIGCEWTKLATVKRLAGKVPPAEIAWIVEMDVEDVKLLTSKMLKAEDKQVRYGEARAGDVVRAKRQATT